MLNFLCDFASTVTEDANLGAFQRVQRPGAVASRAFFRRAKCFDPFFSATNRTDGGWQGDAQGLAQDRFIHRRRGGLAPLHVPRGQRQRQQDKQQHKG